VHGNELLHNVLELRRVADEIAEGLRQPVWVRTDEQRLAGSGGPRNLRPLCRGPAQSFSDPDFFATRAIAISAMRTTAMVVCGRVLAPVAVCNVSWISFQNLGRRLFAVTKPP
jgi:hypothetical protein